MTNPCLCSVLLFGLGLSGVTRAGFLCPQSNGYFPDPDNCQIYYRCVDGGWDRHSCGPGTVFNPTHNTCDYASRVKGCGHGSKNNPSPSSSAAPHPSYRPTASSPAYPTTRYPPTQEPPTRYPPTQEPPTRYPPTQEPPTRYPPTQQPPTRYPPTRYPPTHEPPTQYPTTRYTQSRYPPTSRYPPSRETTPKRDYGKFQCKSDGYFGHPKYCDRFYRCVMTRPILFQCAPGTYFDDIIGTCNYKAQVTECDDDGIKHGGPGPAYRPTHRPTRRPSQRPSQEPTHWPSQETTKWRQESTQWTSAMPSYSPAA